jgi:hypothetical protein
MGVRLQLLEIGEIAFELGESSERVDNRPPIHGTVAEIGVMHTQPAARLESPAADLPYQLAAPS